MHLLTISSTLKTTETSSQLLSIAKLIFKKTEILFTFNEVSVVVKVIVTSLPLQ